MSSQTTPFARQPPTEVRPEHDSAAVRKFSLHWLTPYGKDGPIAIFTLAAIAAHLWLRFLWSLPALELWPLYLALVVGGLPLLAGLVRQAVKLEFGSDWLAGISIVTATLLHEYLVACIVVLMLSGGSALSNMQL